METVIADAGPLVAYFDRGELHHEWVCSVLQKMTKPMVTCDAVLAETAFVLSRKGQHADMVFSLLTEGLVTLGFETAKHHRELAALMRVYRDVPMSLADASLVRMSELNRDSVLFTLDRDFRVYRRNGRQRIPLLAPFA